MSRGFLMITDALLSFMIISSSIVIISSLFDVNVDYSRVYLHSLTSDVAAIIDYNDLSSIQSLVDLAPNSVCLRVKVNGDSYVTAGCPVNYHGDMAVTKRTHVSDSFSVIEVNAWWFT